MRPERPAETRRRTQRNASFTAHRQPHGTRRHATRSHACRGGNAGAGHRTRAQQMKPGEPFIARRDGHLFIENWPAKRVAEHFGTPCYAYSKAALEHAFREYDDALAGAPHLICYAVKANSTLGVLNVFAKLGAGFDIVSGGELSRVLAAGGKADKVVFSGVGKTEGEMRAALYAGIKCFNVESPSELERLSRVAGEMGKVAPVSIRVNPDVDAKTHAHISTGKKENKFGIAYDKALDTYLRAAELPNLEIVGIDCHIGSQVVDPAPLYASMTRLLDLVDQLASRGIRLHHISNGGGLGIQYRDEPSADIGAYVREVRSMLGARGYGGMELMLEPGRSLVGNAGVLITRVEYLKDAGAKRFAVIDAAMNDLARPAIYGAWHEIIAAGPDTAPVHSYEIVGPICESTDKLGEGRALGVSEGDLVAILSAGAYAMSMASNYNTRPRPPEVLIDGGEAHLIRRRETIAELFSHESVPASG
jgi:diaminopimelate decarboxylase